MIMLDSDSKWPKVRGDKLAACSFDNRPLVGPSCAQHAQFEPLLRISVSVSVSVSMSAPKCRRLGTEAN